jgi:hypothetical protein
MTLGAYAISGTVAISETTWVSPELGATWYVPGANDLLLDRRAEPESTVTTSGPLAWYRFDVSALVQEWLDGMANNGTMLRCESCTGKRLVKEDSLEDGEPAGEGEDVSLRPDGFVGLLAGNLCPYTFFFASSEYSDMGKRPRLVVRYR